MKLGRVLIALLLHPAWATPREDCAAALTSADAAYARLLERDVRGPTFDRAVVTLIGQTLDPVLLKLRARIDRISARSFALVRETLVTSHLDRSSAAIPAGVRGMGFDARYPGLIECTGQMEHSVACTEFNERIMLRLIRAIAVLNHFTWLWRDEMREDQHVLGGRAVMTAHSASGTDLTEVLWLANDSVLQAAAQLTAEPVAGRTAEWLRRRCWARARGRPSLVNALALALPPGLLGPHGDHHFVRKPLEMKDGELRLSDRYRSFLRLGRERFRARAPLAWELGRGCPVAHGAADGSITGLDAYLAAIERIYDILGPAP